MPSRRSAEPPARPKLLLRGVDQAAVAALTLAALVSMTAYWFLYGGHRGELIDIDRAEPLEARFRVDINQADWPELAQLPEIGETLARRIVESRNKQGPFLDQDQLQRVRGIGPATLDRIRPYLLPLPDSGDVAGR